MRYIRSIVKRFTSRNLVLIYQYGKVGSTSLANSIDGAVNVHDLYCNPICPSSFELRYSILNRHVFFPLDRLFRRLLLKLRAEVTIVVPIREPWSRNISMFFQDLPFWYVKHFQQFPVTQKQESLNLIKDIFLRSFEHNGPENWFKNELMRLTGIDYRKLEFNKEDGYINVQNGRYRCLLITTACLRSQSGKEVLEKFLDRNILIKDENRGNHKWYKAVYSEFLQDSEFVECYKRKFNTSKVQTKFFK